MNSNPKNSANLFPAKVAEYGFTSDNKWFYKLRVSFSEKELKEIFPTTAEQETITQKFEDTFYDTEDFEYGSKDQYIRKRKMDKIRFTQDENLATSEDVIIQLSTPVVEENVRCYVQKPFTGELRELVELFKYKCKRMSKLYKEDAAHSIVIVTDTIISPVYYKVVTIKFVFNNGLPLFGDWEGYVMTELAKLSLFYQRLLEVPIIFTKFMFVLQVSKHYQAYESVYVEIKSTQKRMHQKTKERVLNEEQSFVDEYKEYLWCSAAIEFFGNLYVAQHTKIKYCHETLNGIWKDQIQGTGSYFLSNNYADDVGLF
jgi:hypothetical protein